MNSYRKRKQVSERCKERDTYLFIVEHASDRLSFADILHTCYKHLAGLAFCLRFVKFEHGSEHITRFWNAFEHMRLEHVLTIELGVAIFTLEGSTG